MQQCSLTCLPKDSPNSNGSQYEFNSCYCNNGSVWNYSLRACVVNCSLLSTTGTLNQTACTCAAGFDWDSALTLCKVNCTGKINSNGNNLNSSHC